MINYLKTFHQLGIIDNKATPNPEAFEQTVKVLADFRAAAVATIEELERTASKEAKNMMADIDYANHVKDVLDQEEKILRDAKIVREDIVLGNGTSVDKYKFMFTNVDPLIAQLEFTKNVGRFGFSKIVLALTKSELAAIVDTIISQRAQNFADLKINLEPRREIITLKIREFIKSLESSLRLPTPDWEPYTNLEYPTLNQLMAFVDEIIRIFQQTWIFVQN